MFSVLAHYRNVFDWVKFNSVIIVVVNYSRFDNTINNSFERGVSVVPILGTDSEDEELQSDFFEGHIAPVISITTFNFHPATPHFLLPRFLPPVAFAPVH